MDLVTIGKLTGTHHLKGALKGNINLGDIETLQGEKILVEKTNGEKRILTLRKISTLVGTKVTLEFDEIKDKTEGSLLVGGFLKVNRSLLGMDEDEYLLEDLLGMAVVTSEKENIGKVVDLMETAADDILVVQDEETETLIPNIDHFVKDIDFEKKEILVELLDGMREERNKK